MNSSSQKKKKCDWHQVGLKNGEFTWNKERLVCKGYVQEEGIEYGEMFSLLARLEDKQKQVR